ncbi:MAG: CD1871A family CXXC motif-containing protein [Clostridia bacterium]|nr:CD1871A family CXXC motif-containing protein [Clostridia bacterium]MEE0443694.1 CD1871A family CXXC motif-containing protein [Acutalibacteraceae bacterium]
MFKAKKTLLQGFLLIAGTVMLCYGAMRGEAETVLSKAIRLCLECIGIG